MIMIGLRGDENAAEVRELQAGCKKTGNRQANW
jgi:hypothetical protein